MSDFRICSKNSRNAMRLFTVKSHNVRLDLKTIRSAELFLQQALSLMVHSASTSKKNVNMNTLLFFLVLKMILCDTKMFFQKKWWIRIYFRMIVNLCLLNYSCSFKDFHMITEYQNSRKLGGLVQSSDYTDEEIETQTG